jgi:hypothetical protein
VDPPLECLIVRIARIGRAEGIWKSQQRYISIRRGGVSAAQGTRYSWVQFFLA